MHLSEEAVHLSRGRGYIRTLLSAQFQCKPKKQFQKKSLLKGKKYTLDFEYSIQNKE